MVEPPGDSVNETGIYTGRDQVRRWPGDRSRSSAATRAWVPALIVCIFLITLNVMISSSIDWSLYFVVPLFMFGSFIPFTVIKRGANNRRVLPPTVAAFIAVSVVLVFLDIADNSMIDWAWFPIVPFLLFGVLLPFLMKAGK